MADERRNDTSSRTGLSCDELRWRCDPDDLPFETTAEVDPVPGIIGQDDAVEALRFGLESRAAGQNVFVRGLTGTGRMTLVQQLLDDIAPGRAIVPDHCYVHNFAHPDRPRLITLPNGRGRPFEKALDELIEFIRDELQRAVATDSVQERKGELDESTQKEIRALVDPFEAKLREAGLALVTMQSGNAVQSTIFPLVEGEPVPPEKFEQLHRAGEIDDERYERYRSGRDDFDRQLREINARTAELRHDHVRAVKDLVEREAQTLLDTFVARITAAFPQEDVAAFLGELVDDVIQRRLLTIGDDDDFLRLYRVNVVREHSGDGCPIVVENMPTLTNLLGSVDAEVIRGGAARSDHLMIRGGAVLQADGGFLVLDARDVLSEPGAWKVLVRTLRSGRLEIVPPDLALRFVSAGVKPEPVDVRVKVILIGDAGTYHLLDGLDPDFPNLFKVLADFDTVMPRDEAGVRRYAGVIARLARTEELPAFERSAVAALVEHGARIAAHQGKLTARFARVADLAREAAFLTAKDGRPLVVAADVHAAVARTKRRADLPARRFREMLADGTVRVQNRGTMVGQVNGLAVMRMGQLTYGFPARITATTGPGTAGVINIEGEAALSGAIHTKGFHILGGLLRHLLQTDHPLAFDASIAFEQSYGGIDGDSASGAEICCLLSALTGVPARQDLAMTGAIDQMGNILAIGAVDEKIEGFHDVCRDAGFTGTQGVIIPTTNAGDLMLRLDVVESCRAGNFHVYAVDTVHEALELLLGMPAGSRGEGGVYPDGSLLELAVRRADAYWRAAVPARVGRPAVAGDHRGDDARG